MVHFGTPSRKITGLFGSFYSKWQIPTGGPLGHSHPCHSNKHKTKICWTPPAPPRKKQLVIYLVPFLDYFWDFYLCVILRSAMPHLAWL